MLDFGKWIVEVAVNGVKSGSFDRAWAAMQLGNHYSRDRITAEDIARFDTAIDEYEAEIKAEQEEIGEEPVEITDAEQSVERTKL